MEHEGKILEFSLHGGNFDKAGEASSKIKRLLQQIGISADIIRKIAICAYEAEMNVIIHAHGGLLKATIYPDYTELRIIDEGPGIPNIELAMKEGYSTAPDFIREMGFGAGMGLPNIKRCADEFSITSEVGKGTDLQVRIKHN